MKDQLVQIINKILFVLSHIYRTFSYEIDNHINDYDVDESIKNALVKARNKKLLLKLFLVVGIVKIKLYGLN